MKSDIEKMTLNYLQSSYEVLSKNLEARDKNISELSSIINRYTEALEWYANEDHYFTNKEDPELIRKYGYDMKPIEADNFGGRAREALGKK